MKEALRKFHREMNHVCLNALDQTHEEHHYIQGHTFAIPEEKFPRIRTIIRNAQQQIAELEEASHDRPNKIYHINLLAAPLTRASKGEKP